MRFLCFTHHVEGILELVPQQGRQRVGIHVVVRAVTGPNLFSLCLQAYAGDELVRIDQAVGHLA